MTDHFAGIDIGGTSIKTLIVDSLGKPLASYQENTSRDVRGQTLSLAKRLVDTHPDIAGIGVVAPGVVDRQLGKIVYAANLNLTQVDLQEPLLNQTGRPTIVDHDGRAAGLAEGVLGAARDSNSFVTVPIGTGISAALCINGQLWSGHTFSSGEIGHYPVFPTGEACSCGQKGCLEVYASATGISKRYATRTKTKLTAAQISGRLQEDPHAAAVWDQATTALALAFTQLTLLLDPERIVIAGGLSAAGNKLLEPITTKLSGLLQWRDTPVISVSPLGSKAGQWGAAILGAQVADSASYQNWRFQE